MLYKKLIEPVCNTLISVCQILTGQKIIYFFLEFEVLLHHKCYFLIRYLFTVNCKKTNS